ncbi:MAG: hypothetical protein ACPGVJ_03020, partial [Mangrovicoccus sp.]
TCSDSARDTMRRVRQAAQTVINIIDGTTPATRRVNRFGYNPKRLSFIAAFKNHQLFPKLQRPQQVESHFAAIIHGSDPLL